LARHGWVSVKSALEVASSQVCKSALDFKGDKDPKALRPGFMLDHWVRYHLMLFTPFNHFFTGFSMARITVEDCLNRIPNRFQLTLAATYRARELAQGHAARIESKDKPTVTALREVAAGVTGLEMLRKVPT